MGDGPPGRARGWFSHSLRLSIARLCWAFFAPGCVLRWRGTGGMRRSAWSSVKDSWVDAWPYRYSIGTAGGELGAGGLGAWGIGSLGLGAGGGGA